MAKIDILLPYWGEFSLLKLAVESVLSQNEQDWILYIIDDCYPSEEAKNYFSNFPDERIVYIRHENNIGITANFNYATRLSKSNFCVILGCDDIMKPDYIDKALKSIGDASFYQPGVEVIDENGKVYHPLGDIVKKLIRPQKSGIYFGQNLAESLCLGNWLYFPSIVWRSDVIKRYAFDDKYKILEDLVLAFNILIDGGKLYIDNDITFQYRRFSKSLSSLEKAKGGVRFNEECDVYDKYSKQFDKLGWKRAKFIAKLRPTSRLHQFITRVS